MAAERAPASPRSVRREHEEQAPVERGPWLVNPVKRAVAIQRTAGNQALVRMLARVKTKKVSGGRKVQYAESEAEATELCRKECQTNGMKWETDIPDRAKETILRYAQTPEIDEVPAGLPAAYELIISEKREAEKRAERRKRKDEKDADDSDYTVLLTISLAAMIGACFCSPLRWAISRRHVHAQGDLRRGLDVAPHRRGPEPEDHVERARVPRGEQEPAGRRHVGPPGRAGQHHRAVERHEDEQSRQPERLTAQRRRG